MVFPVLCTSQGGALPASSLQLPAQSMADPLLCLPLSSHLGFGKVYPIFFSAFPLSLLALASVSIELKPIGSIPLKCPNQQDKVIAHKSQQRDQAEQGRDAGELSEQDDRHDAGGKFTALGLGSGPPFYYILHRAT